MEVAETRGLAGSSFNSCELDGRARMVFWRLTWPWPYDCEIIILIDFSMLIFIINFQLYLKMT